MKAIFVAFTFILSLSISAQDRIKLQTEEKSISRHELGINFNSYSSRLEFVPQLSYNYYLREDRILHFSGSVAINGEFYRSVGIEFWNEKRKYFGEKQKWFLSHGLTLNAGYSRFNYGQFAPQIGKFSGLSTGFGYNLGAGFKVNEHFTLAATYRPTINYLQTNSEKVKSGWKLNSSFNLGINYRF